MSATRQPKRPGSADAYYTPEPLARAIVATLAGCTSNPMRILEPSSGGGAFLRAAREKWPSAYLSAIDRDPDAIGAALAAASVGSRGSRWQSWRNR